MMGGRAVAVLLAAAVTAEANRHSAGLVDLACELPSARGRSAMNAGLAKGAFGGDSATGAGM